MVILFSLLAVVFTFLGGLLALKIKDKLHLILGFSAGAVIGVAFFDLLPESLALGEKYGSETITAVVAAGFVLFMLLDRFLVIHAHVEDEECHNITHRGKFAVGALSIHSLLDGIGIGLAFQVSTSVGLIVAIAVLAHDFSDGINTVNLVIKNHGNRAEAFKWLLLDAIAPAVGALSTLFFSVPEATLGIILAVFCGFFFYIGASDILPESHHRHPTIWTTVSTLLGIGLIYIVIHLAAI